MSQITLEKQCVIRRPVDVVRAHFLDVDHHIRNEVHKAIQYTVLARGPRTRVRSCIRFLGVAKHDEIVIYEDAQGDVVQEFVCGDFAGGTLKIRFRAEAPERTHLSASFDVPARGLNRLMKPLARKLLSRLTEQAIEEDRVDLEQGGYLPAAARETLPA